MSRRINREAEVKRLYKLVQRVLPQYEVQSVADVAAVSYQTVYNYMYGKVETPHYSSLRRVADAIGVA